MLRFVPCPTYSTPTWRARYHGGDYEIMESRKDGKFEVRWTDWTAPPPATRRGRLEKRIGRYATRERAKQAAQRHFDKYVAQR